MHILNFLSHDSVRNNSMGSDHHWVSNDGVGNNGMGNNGMSDDRMGNLRNSHSHSGSVLRGAGVAHVLDNSITVVSVGDGLDTPVRKVDSVAA